MKRAAKFPKSSRRETTAGLTLEVVSASVPSHIIIAVKERVSKRGFSQFVARSLERELQRDNQRSFIAEAEANIGPIDTKAIARAERSLRS